MSTAHFVGVSIPRAGHHYLMALVGRLLGERFRHCEFYTPADCCRSVPCHRPDAEVFWQKNHDLELRLPSDLGGVVYVVQWRTPVMAVLSDREYMASLEGARADDHQEYVVWLGKKAAYLERFYLKWVRPAIPNRVLIDYDELVDSPVSNVERLLRAGAVDFDPMALEKVVEASREQSASFPASTRTPRFSRRALGASRYFDSELLAAFESLLIDRLPELAGSRSLAPVPYREQPLAHVHGAEIARGRGELKEAIRHVEASLEIAGDNRHLQLERIDLLAAAGHTAAALAAAEAISGESAAAGDDPAILRRLSDLHLRRSREELQKARVLSERLVEQRSDDPGLRVHLASILIALREGGHAQEHALRALGQGPRDPYVWRVASEIFAQCGNWEPAIAAVRGAIAHDEPNPEFHHHHANMLSLAGRRAEAEVAHRRAIGLAPDRPGWRWKLAEDLVAVGDREAARTVVADALELFPDHVALRALQERLEVTLPGEPGE